MRQHFIFPELGLIVVIVFVTYGSDVAKVPRSLTKVAPTQIVKPKETIFPEVVEISSIPAFLISVVAISGGSNLKTTVSNTTAQHLAYFSLSNFLNLL